MRILTGLQRVAMVFAVLAAFVGFAIGVENFPTKEKQEQFWADAIASDIAGHNWKEPRDTERVKVVLGGVKGVLRSCEKSLPEIAKPCAGFKEDISGLRWRQAEVAAMGVAIALCSAGFVWCCWLVLAWVIRGFMPARVQPPSA